MIRVQFGQSLPLTIMDQMVGDLSMSRWSSNEGACARAGARHYERWRGVQGVRWYFLLWKLLLWEKIVYSPLGRGRSCSPAAMPRCSRRLSWSHGGCGSQRRETRGPGGRARLASEPRYQPLDVDGRRDGDVFVSGSCLCPDSACSAAKGAHPLREGAFNPRPAFVNLARHRYGPARGPPLTPHVARGDGTASSAQAWPGYRAPAPHRPDNPPDETARRWRHQPTGSSRARHTDTPSLRTPDMLVVPVNLELVDVIGTVHFICQLALSRVGPSKSMPYS